jgi:hypothetical protein
MAKTTTTTKNNRIDFFKDALGKNTTLHNTFEKLYNAKKGDWPAIAKVLQKNKNFSAVQVKNLSFTHELANWTGDNKTLVTLFQKNNKTNSLRDIALTLNKNDLSKLVTSNAVPKGETKAAYIGKLYNDLYQNKPTEVITNIIKDPNVPLLNNKIGKNVTDLLAKHPDFNIRTTSVYNGIKKTITGNLS